MMTVTETATETVLDYTARARDLLTAADKLKAADAERDFPDRYHEGGPIPTVSRSVDFADPDTGALLGVARLRTGGYRVSIEDQGNTVVFNVTDTEARQVRDYITRTVLAGDYVRGLYVRDLYIPGGRGQLRGVGFRLRLASESVRVGGSAAFTAPVARRAAAWLVDAADRIDAETGSGRAGSGESGGDDA